MKKRNKTKLKSIATKQAIEIAYQDMAVPDPEVVDILDLIKECNNDQETTSRESDSDHTENNQNAEQ